MAEMVMKELCRQADVAEQFEIASAAVSSEETGNDIYPPAQRKLREKGIPFGHHAARQITPADYAYYDYIICADRSNLRRLEWITGKDTDHKVSLMMNWIERGEGVNELTSERMNGLTGYREDVADPWYTGDFEAAYRDIEQSCQAILKQLNI